MGSSIGKQVPVKAPINKIQIELCWEDGYGQTKKGFNSVQELADFLKANPELAEEVGYVPKKDK